MTNNFASFFVALTLGVLYGITLNISGPVITQDVWNVMGAKVAAFISVSLSIGAFVGSFFGGFISDRAGPKKTLAGGILISLVCVVWTWSIQEKLYLLIILRIIDGLGIGVATSIGPQYIAEQASAERRGMFTTMFQLFVCAGQLLSFAVGLGFSSVGDNDSVVDIKWRYDNAWRYDILSTGLFALIFLIGWFKLPESAGYVAAQNHRARAALLQASGNINADSASPDPQGSTASSGTPSLWDDVKGVFTAAVSSKRAFAVGVVLAVFQQITGINIFMLYSNQIFEDIFHKLNQVASVVMGAWNFVVVVIAIFLVDRLGRKPLLISGFLLMLVGTVVITVLGFMDTKHPQTDRVKIAFTVPSVAIYLLGFQIGPGPMFFVTVAELYDGAVRGRAMGLMLAINWLSNIAVSYVFPIMYEHWHMPVFIMFAVLSFIVIIFIVIFVREMKNKKLQGQGPEPEPEEDSAPKQPLNQETQYLSGDRNTIYSE